MQSEYRNAIKAWADPVIIPWVEAILRSHAPVLRNEARTPIVFDPETEKAPVNLHPVFHFSDS